MTISVLLVDDHPIVRDGYRRLLGGTDDIKVVGEAGDGETALVLYDKLKPDVVVVDLTMPGMDGLELIRRLKLEQTSVRILVFSMHNSEALIQRCIELGALGYLIKSSGMDQLVEAVRHVAAELSYIDQSLSKKIAAGRFVPSRTESDTLTAREFQIFRLLAEGQTVQQIAGDLGISASTAGVHRANIMKKTGARNESQLVLMAVRQGVIEP
jgi:two-component system invasion response regulator UvrY